MLAFEWDADEVIQHTRDAIRASAHFMEFFVDEVRLCPLSYMHHHTRMIIIQCSICMYIFANVVAIATTCVLKYMFHVSFDVLMC